MEGARAEDKETWLEKEREPEARGENSSAGKASGKGGGKGAGVCVGQSPRGVPRGEQGPLRGVGARRRALSSPGPAPASPRSCAISSGSSSSSLPEARTPGAAEWWRCWDLMAGTCAAVGSGLTQIPWQRPPLHLPSPGQACPGSLEPAGTGQQLPGLERPPWVRFPSLQARPRWWPARWSTCLRRCTAVGEAGVPGSESAVQQRGV